MDAKAQSEARRRKILENADARLRKIAEIQFSSGTEKKVKEEEKTNGTNNIEEVAQISCEVNERRKMGGGDEGEETSKWEAEGRDPLLVKMLESVLSEDSNQPRLEQRDSPWKEYAAVAVLAVIVRILYAVNFSWLYGQVMWVPFVVVIIPIVAESVVKCWSVAPGGLLVSMLLVNRVPPRLVSAVCCVASIIRHLLRLFSFYLFTFLVAHSVLPEPA